MTVSIIGRDNGSGLTKDRDILLGIIPNSQFRSIDHFHPPEQGISIFTEIIDTRYLNDYNILIPNQEWFFRGWIKELKKFQAIWVKTHLAFQIFSSMHPNVKYIGFTSIDMYRGVEKKPICFHAQGKSSDKGTEFLIKWEKDLPHINILSHKLHISKQNVKVHRNRLGQDQYEILANESLIHICPSTMEGFGHYINEAKSMGSVVVTTDSAPMNELIADKRFLCRIVSADQKDSCLGTWTRTNSEEINKTVKGILDLDLIEIGKQNRVEFLKQDADFKERLKYELSKI